MTVVLRNFSLQLLCVFALVVVFLLVGQQWANAITVALSGGCVFAVMLVRDRASKRAKQRNRSAQEDYPGGSMGCNP